ncbi:hypothetical protein [Streptomyces sp. NBC_00162]|uniref:hypothetical protein n=1 Tax=Streptomyces sp. NBC_00162 TaxID=2903629 RepID=UPI00214BA8F0|nr:hypothetical protein [Streptomyces sp. NBC_00162]UUU37671.1 hypothetical protein JIW86_01315 [Streptomyces sp. NBC_00162]
MLMQKKSRSTFSAVSVALAVCAAAVATAGCGRADTGTAPAAAAHEAPAAPQAPSSPTSAPPPDKKSADPKAGPQSSAPSAPRSPDGKATQGKGDPGGTAARTVAVKPEGLAKLPVEKSLGWKPDGPLSSQELKGQKITLNECATVAGATLWQQQGYLSSARNAAGQQLFFFPDAASAKGAYDRLVVDMNNCQPTSRGIQAREGVPQDAVVSTTATVKDGTAWSRHWTGVGGMTARDVQTNHLYAVHQGDHLLLFQFDELADRPAPPHDTGTDAAVLGALADLGAQN